MLPIQQLICFHVGALKDPAKTYSHQDNELLFFNGLEGNCCELLANYSQQLHKSQELVRGEEEKHQTATVTREVTYILGRF